VGTQKVSCTGTQTIPVIAFTGCTNLTGIAMVGAGVSQAKSIGGISLSVTEPGTAYTYTLVGTPRSFSTAQYTPGGINAPPFLISPTNSCSGLSWNGNMSIQINGNVGLNGSVMGDAPNPCPGTQECKGNSSSITSTGFAATQGSAAFNGCRFSGTNTTTTLPATIADPYAAVVPAYGSPAFPKYTGTSVNPPPGPGRVCAPGEYTTAAAFQNCTYVQPGVYVLDGGWTQTVTLASGSPPGQGVLLYVPQGGAISGTFNNLPGLSAFQAATSLGNSALQGFAVWQDVTNTNPVSLGGNGSSDTTGILYLPGATLTTGGTASFTAQRIIASSVVISGGGNGGGTCNVDLCVTGP
jgi:hypothetical protein